MKKALRIFLVAWLIFSFVYIGLNLKSRSHSDKLEENARFVAKILGLIDECYIDEIKLREVVYPAIKSMVNQLDPHSHFWTPEEYKKIREKRKDIQEYAGIGAFVGFRQNWQALRDSIKSNNFDINEASIEIKKPFDNSSAQKAGLLPKDEIVAVDGVSVKEIGAAEVAEVSQVEMKMGMKLREVVGKILGAAGTSVRLTIKREGWVEAKNFDIFRQKIQIRNVEWKIIFTDKNEKIGYLQIYGFSARTTVKNVKNAVRELKDSGVSGLIIDLRNNPGGFLHLCIEALENFLPSDSLVISAEGKIGEDKFYTSSDYSDYFSVPLVILVNNSSASASEIFAGTLRDYKRAVLIGERTHGKGSMQREWKFSDGSALWLTIQKYFFPSGKSIHEKGIFPDIEVRTDFDEPIIPIALEVLLNWESYKEKFLK